MILQIPFSSGVAPAVDEAELADGAASSALAAKFQGGALKAFANYAAAATHGKTPPYKAIYRFGIATPSDTNYWFASQNDVNWVKGPITNDATERTYYTGESEPRVTDNVLALVGGGNAYPNTWYTLGVPAPTLTPALTVTGAGGTTADTRSYLFTYVTGWGEESAPSPSPAPVAIAATQSVTLTNLGTAAPSGAYNILYKRIYVAETTASGNTDWYYLAQIPITQASYTDTFSHTLGDPIATGTWVPPPAGMKGLVSAANSILGGFVNNTLCLSEPGAPYAWPVAYRLDMDYPIVGLGTWGQSIFVGTTGAPYVVSGNDPASMTRSKLAFPYACASKRSIANFGDGVVYASPSGLAYVGDQGNVLLTKDLFKRADWQALVPSSIHGYQHDGKYFGFYDTGTVKGGFIFSPFDSTNNFTFHSLWFDACYVDMQRDCLFAALNNAISKWEGDTSTFLSYAVTSKLYYLPAPTSLGAAQVLAASYANLTITIYFDGGSTYSTAVTGPEPFRLPSGNKPRTVKVKVAGTDTVRVVYLADTVRELKRV